MALGGYGKNIIKTRSGSNPVSPGELTLQDIMNTLNDFKIHELNATLSDLGKKVAGITESIQFLSDKYDTVTQKLEAEIKTNQKKDEKIAFLERENQNLWDSLESTKLLCIQLDQQNRNKTCEIHGVEEKTGENVEEIVEAVAHELKLKWNKDEVESVYRMKVTNKKKRGPIIVQFTKRNTCNTWLEKRRTGLSSKNLISNSDEHPIFINENLNNYHKDLFWRTREATKKAKFKFAWVKGGKIWVKKDEESPVLNIKTLDDILKIN